MDQNSYSSPNQQGLGEYYPQQDAQYVQAPSQARIDYEKNLRATMTYDYLRNPMNQQFFRCYTIWLYIWMILSFISLANCIFGSIYGSRQQPLILQIILSVTAILQYLLEIQAIKERNLVKAYIANAIMIILTIVLLIPVVGIAFFLPEPYTGPPTEDTVFDNAMREVVVIVGWIMGIGLCFQIITLVCGIRVTIKLRKLLNMQNTELLQEY